jgi:hypothetical protein
MSETSQRLVVDHAEWTSFFDEFERESERATAILAAAWIDHLLELKLAEHFSSGNAKARPQLFAANGPFGTSSAKITTAFCVGWLDVDVYHDLNLIRKIRNSFAHQVHGLSMESPTIRSLIESLKVPHREYYDWGKLKCAAINEGIGVVFYTETPPENVGAQLLVPAAFTFRLAASWAIAYLVAKLGIGIRVLNETPFNEPEDTVEHSGDT